MYEFALAGWMARWLVAADSRRRESLLEFAVGLAHSRARRRLRRLSALEHLTRRRRQRQRPNDNNLRKAAANAPEARASNRGVAFSSS